MDDGGRDRKEEDCDRVKEEEPRNHLNRNQPTVAGFSVGFGYLSLQHVKISTRVLGKNCNAVLSRQRTYPRRLAVQPVLYISFVFNYLITFHFTSQTFLLC